MAVETLYVPEDHLADVIRVIRAGLAAVDVPDEVAGPLEAWCVDASEYLERIGGGP